MSPSGMAASRNRQIAGNTVILFLRIFVITIINLYAVRILLDNLGETDYGIFNAVAGVVMATSFINGTLDVAIQRFYSMAIGKKDALRLSDIFSTGINIISVLSAIIFITFEIVGLWLINTQMTIPADRLHAANVSFHLALVTFILTIMQIPFTATVFAHENMRLYTVISTAECLLRLAAAVLAGCMFTDRLVFYNTGLMVTGVLIFLIYACIARKKYPECRYKRVHDRKLTKQLLSFSGWTILGPIARTGMFQGNTILLNIFFGPVANVAFAIAQQINNAFGTLANCIVLALRPPMIKAYAEEDKDYMNSLFSLSNKILFYILLVVSVPIILEMDTIMSLWLKDAVTEQTVLFARLMIVFVVIMAMNNPITIIIYAIGKIRRYHTTVESVTLLCLPLTWLLFRCGYPAQYMLWAMIAVMTVAHVVRLLCLKNVYKAFSITRYAVSFCVPAVITTVLCIITAAIIHRYCGIPLLRIPLEGLTILLMSAVSVYFVGLTAHERARCNKMIKNKVNRICTH